MSVIVVGKMKTDPANIKKLWANRKADFEAVANEARAAGALHHRWGFGDGFITIIDEWPDAATFESFFSATPASHPSCRRAACRVHRSSPSSKRSRVPTSSDAAPLHPVEQIGL